MKHNALVEPCPQWLALQNALHADDLTPEERARLHAHLNTCERCRAVQEQYEAINKLILDLPRARPLPALLLQIQGTANALPEPDTANGSMQNHRVTPILLRRQHGSRMRRSLNLIAAVLVVTVLLSSFLVLFHFRQATGGIGAGSSLYVLTSIGHGEYAAKDISAASGAEHVLWQRQLNNVSLSYPIYVHGAFYLPASDGNVYALNPRDGQVLWYTNFRFDNGEQLGWLMSYQNMIVAIVTHRDDGSGDLYGLNAQTGGVVWHTHIVCGPSSPANCAGQGRIMNLTNGIIYAMAFDGVSAWSASDGRFLWRNSKYFFNGQPQNIAVAGGRLYVTNFFPRIDVLNAQSGKFLQSMTPPLESDDPGVVIDIAADEHNVYVLGGKSVTAYRGSDSLQLWQHQLPYHGASSIFVGKSRVIVNGENFTFGKLQANGGHPRLNDVYALSPTDGKQLWIGHVAPGGLPVEVNGVLYFSRSNSLAALRASDGTALWQLIEKDEIIGLFAA